MPRTFLTVVLFLLCSMSVNSQSWIDEAPIITTHVAGNVYMIEGAGGNIGVSVGDDGILMIDDQFAQIADKIKAALGEIHKGSLQFILNTHSHRDHVTANAIFGAEGVLIAHKNVRSRMIESFKSDPDDAMAVGKDGWPVITFESSLSIHFNGEELKVIHYPKSHTDGDAVIFFEKSNVIHMGDLMFSGLFPYIDLDSGGDVDEYIKSVKSILDIAPDDCMIIPGHGPLSTKKELQEFYEMMISTTDFIRAEMSNGKTMEEIQKAGLDEQWKSWSWSFIPENRWIEIIFNGNSK
jgi:glyoxylase-like metal-dependent hydrolase (beta-lactamase superfamily II)